MVCSIKYQTCQGYSKFIAAYQFMITFLLQLLGISFIVVEIIIMNASKRSFCQLIPNNANDAITEFDQLNNNR